MTSSVSTCSVGREMPQPLPAASRSSRQRAASLPAGSGEWRQGAAPDSTTIIITADGACGGIPLSPPAIQSPSAAALSADLNPTGTSADLHPAGTLADLNPTGTSADLHTNGGSGVSGALRSSPTGPSIKVTKTEKIFYCPYQECCMSFLRQYRLKVHLRSHSQNRPFTCDHPGCTASFYERSKLNRHKQKHAEAQHQCEVCGARFRQASNLRRHSVTVHSGASPAQTPPLFPAEQLSLPFSGEAANTSSSTSKEHYWCESCDRKFCRKVFYVRHRCPSKPLPGGSNRPEVNYFRCAHAGCDFTASSRTAVTVHRRCHAPRRFRCLRPNCSWSFLTLAKLRRHQLQHTFRRDFACPVSGCLRRYRRLEYLVRHVRSCHRVGSRSVSGLRNPLSCPPGVIASLKPDPCVIPEASALTSACISQCSPVGLCEEQGTCSFPSTSRQHATISGSKILSGCLRALGVGRLPCYLKSPIGRGDGAPLCSRTDLVYCSSARVPRHSVPPYFSSERTDPPRSSRGHLVPTVAPSGLTSHRRRSTSRPSPKPDSSADRENSCQQQDCGSNPGLLFPIDHVFLEETDVLMDSFSLFGEDPLRSSIASTINLNDLA